MKNVLFVVAVLVVFLTGFIGLSDVVITYTSGSCKVDRDGRGKFGDAEIDMELGAASILRTGPDGALELTVDGETVMIGADSTVKVGGLIAGMNAQAPGRPDPRGAKRPFTSEFLCSMSFVTERPCLA